LPTFPTVKFFPSRALDEMSGAGGRFDRFEERCLRTSVLFFTRSNDAVRSALPLLVLFPEIAVCVTVWARRRLDCNRWPRVEAERPSVDALVVGKSGTWSSLRFDEDGPRGRPGVGVVVEDAMLGDLLDRRFENASR
jgi:hypothetical protein